MKSTVVLMLLVASTLLSCQKNKEVIPPKNDNGITPPKDTVSSVAPKDRLSAIVLSDTLNMYVGKTRQLPIVLTPSNYHLDSLKFVSSDTTILTISKLGLMSAKKTGKLTVSVSNLNNTVSKSTTVTVLANPIDTIGLIAYYPFNNSAADMSGKGFNGIAVNVTPTSDRFGRANAAYYFNNSTNTDSSWVIIKDNPKLRLSGTDFTINAWVKIDVYNDFIGAMVMDKRLYLSSACWTLGLSGQLQYFQGISGVGTPYFGTSDYRNGPFVTGDSLDTTNWHMITTTYTLVSRAAEMYVDGILVRTAANVPGPDTYNTADIYIGRDNPIDNASFNFQGKIDDIRIYNIAITAQQINDLYNAKN